MVTGETKSFFSFAKSVSIHGSVMYRVGVATGML